MKRYQLLRTVLGVMCLATTVWVLIDQFEPLNARTIRNPMITESDTDLILTINHDPFLIWDTRQPDPCFSLFAATPLEG